MARPKEFEPQEALEKAMQQFRAKGYHDTSIRDLVERTGVNYYGLYGEFENKRGLFLAALDHYSGTVTAELVRQITRPGPLAASLKRIFDRLLDLMKTEDGPVGCLMCNTAIELAPYDLDAAEKVQANMAQLRQAFETKLLEGRQADELTKTKDLGAMAEFLTTTALSVGFLVRAGCDDGYVRRHIRTALTAVI